jgi:hypothetical protein
MFDFIIQVIFAALILFSLVFTTIGIVVIGGFLLSILIELVTSFFTE